MSNPINNAQPNYCRRRAIWGQTEGNAEGVSNGRGTSEKAVQERSNPLPAVTKISQFACLKCGKEFRRGMFIHQKFCKG